MKRSRIAIVVLAMVVVSGLAWADENRGKNSLKAELKGFEEVPAISSTGTGEFRARIIDNSSIEFELSYENLEGVEGLRMTGRYALEL